MTKAQVAPDDSNTRKVTKAQVAPDDSNTREVTKASLSHLMTQNSVEKKNTVVVAVSSLANTERKFDHSFPACVFLPLLSGSFTSAH